MPVEGHAEYASKCLDSYEWGLEVNGWAKLSGGCWYIYRYYTQAQFDAIFDWHQANDRRFTAEDFKVE